MNDSDSIISVNETVRLYYCTFTIRKELKMSTRNFWHMVEKQYSKGKFVCVGLDSDIAKIPQPAKINRHNYPKKGVALDIGATLFNFNSAIIQTTSHLACVYKPNIAFYEAHGSDGLHSLQQTILYINRVAPEVPVILDAKRADIGNTNAGYVDMAFDFLKADAITVNPYFGGEALQPFLNQKDKGIFVLCRTSNPGAGEFQDLSVNGELLYRFVARRVTGEWNKNNNCALVVGATCPDELCEVRRIVGGNMTILIPGIGAQGGDVEKTVTAGKNMLGKGIIINSSRGIIFASDGPDFAEAAFRKTQELHNLINQHRKVVAS